MSTQKKGSTGSKYEHFFRTDKTNERTATNALTAEVSRSPHHQLEGRANESRQREPRGVVTHKGKIEGYFLSKVVLHVVQRLVPGHHVESHPAPDKFQAFGTVMRRENGKDSLGLEHFGQINACSSYTGRCLQQVVEQLAPDRGREGAVGLSLHVQVLVAALLVAAVDEVIRGIYGIFCAVIDLKRLDLFRGISSFTCLAQFHGVQSQLEIDVVSIFLQHLLRGPDEHDQLRQSNQC